MIPELPKRLKQAAVLTAPIAVIEMARHLTGKPDLHGANLLVWHVLVAGGTTLVVFKPGFPLMTRGWASFASKRLNMFSLIAPGILITYAYSLCALLLPGIFPESFRVNGHIPVYFEAAAMITTLVLLGQYLEARAEQHTGDALNELAKLLPEKACVIRDGREEPTALEHIQAGDHIRLRAGDRVPVDGSVVSGEASVNESMLTGEPLPVVKRSRDTVTGGTLVLDGTLLILVKQTGNSTVLAQIIAMVEAARESKAPIQRLADRVTGKLVPVVMLIALSTLVIWSLTGPEPALLYGIIHAVTVLMITCPCALGLATPVSITTGMGRGALEGILIKDAAHLELLAAADTIILDKTGTLTTGEPAIHSIVPFAPFDLTQLICDAASLEQYSRHPLAAAITSHAGQQMIPLKDAADFKSSHGRGISGVVDGRKVVAGNRAWLEENAITLTEQQWETAEQFQRTGCSLVWVGIDARAAGLIAIADPLKPRAAEIVGALKARQLNVCLLTGDSSITAQSIADQIDISTVYAEVQPGEKADIVAKRSAGGNVTIMVGDGINDAPALAMADVGIAMGTGTETARASGHIILTRGDLASLVQAIDLSRAIMRNIRQNLYFAFAYNAVMIPVAAGILFPFTGLMLTPMLASAAMSASSISVISNALRLRKLNLRV